MIEIFIDICGYVFYAWLLYRVFRILKTLTMYFTEPTTDFAKFADGGYALITGAAGGIGKAMAHEFAKRGINLFLFDFNESLLETTVNELKSLYSNINVKTRVMNLRDLIDATKYKRFCDEINDIKIGILFNCAGIGKRLHYFIHVYIRQFE